MFQLTQKEIQNLRSHFVTSSFHGGNRYAPFAFTEQGIAMLSSVLNSDEAIAVNISIMRAFVLLRQHLDDYKDLKDRIMQLEIEMNIKFKDIHQALNYLLQKEKIAIDHEKRDRIGFKTSKSKE